MKKILILWILVTSLITTITAQAESLWQELPDTPTLPVAERSGFAPVNGIRIWYAIYGKGDPVILLHGGLANSNYWGNQVPVLAKEYQVIVMDSRGQGRSTRDEKPYGYDLMAADVVGLMDFLKIKQAAIVGWSDGAIIGLDIAIHYPTRLTKLFAFGANSNPEGVVADNGPITDAVSREQLEYEKLSTTPSKYTEQLIQVRKMWATQPNFTEVQLNTITVPTWIVDGDHDEVIKRENTEFMARAIPKAGLLLLPDVSHFAFLQDPEMFNELVLHFLKYGE
jgi:pimeloyl-ACP methyl ester carboxylesterase